MNLKDRITDAEDHGWTGEAEGLKVSLAAAATKLAQLSTITARHTEVTSLGMPAFRDIAGHTTTVPARQPDHRTQ